MEEADGVRLIRSAYEEAPDTGGLPWRSLRGEPGTVTLLVGPIAAGTPMLWPRLGELLDLLAADGVTGIRLALAGAGASQPDRPPLAQRIADGWELEVTATDGTVVVVPDGSLFADGDGSGPCRGWSRFTPGAEPVLIGLRHPAPAWQAAFNRLPASVDGDCEVDGIPAGALVRSRHDPRQRPGHLAYAVAPDARRPVILIGSPRGRDVPADAVAALLATLPAGTRAEVRLAPGSHRDVLPVAQEVSDLLGTEVEVLTGVPRIAGDGGRGREVRVTATDASSTPTWRPAVEAVRCHPAHPRTGRAVPPRPVGLRSPLVGVKLSARGSIDLSDRWRLTLTRAGVVLENREQPAARPAELPVDPERFIIDASMTGGMSDPSLLRACERLLSDLDPDLRAYAELRVPALSGDELRDARRMAVRHRVALAPARHPLRAPREAPAQRTAPQGPSSRPRGPGRARPGAERPWATAAVPDGAESAAHGLDDGQRASAPSLTAGTPTATAARPPAATATPAPSPQLRADGRPLDPGSAPVTPRQPVPSPPAPAAEEPAASPPPSRPWTGPIPRQSPVSTRVPTPSQTRPAEPTPESGNNTVPKGTPSPARPTASAQPHNPGPPSQHEGQQPAVPAPVAARSPAPGKAPGPRRGPSRPAAASNPSTPFRPLTELRTPPTEEDRAAFRKLVGSVWDRHAAAVNGALTRTPGMRGIRQDEALSELIAVHLYLTSDPGPLSAQALNLALRTGDDSLLPYAVCLAAGLRRLPSFRGAAVRGSVDGASHLPEDPVPGTVLRDAAPLGALPVKAARTGSPEIRYAVWSLTARRARPLLGTATPDMPADLVLFPPGTSFDILETSTAQGGVPLVLLRELPGPVEAHRAHPDTSQEARQAALTRLKEALGQLPARQPEPGRPTGRPWPKHCADPHGDPLASHRSGESAPGRDTSAGDAAR
ncbi:hypothetical protein ACWDG1_45550 [Streptomyces sp. NPDC001177]